MFCKSNNLSKAVTVAHNTSLRNGEIMLLLCEIKEGVLLDTCVGSAFEKFQYLPQGGTLFHISEMDASDCHFLQRNRSFWLM